MASARWLVDVNLLSDPTEPGPNGRVVDWLRRHESKLAVDPVVLGEIRFGILLLDEGRRRQRLERWFEEGIRGPIAATALAHDLTAAIFDQRDFAAVGVRLADPSGS